MNKEIDLLFNMFRLQLFLLLTLTNTMLLNAANYNHDVINIYSKMLPRFIMMSSQKSKIDDDIEICVLRDSIDVRVAQLLSDNIKNNYPNGILNHSIKLTQGDYNHLESCKNAQLMFMFNSDDKHIESALLFSQENALMTITYDVLLLEKGADISLFLGRKVTPYLNMKSITEKNILLDNILLRVSKIYIKSDR